MVEIKGKVVAILPTQSGTSKNGPWTKQEIVVEVPGQYPKKVCFALPKDKIGTVRQGEEVTATVSIESREYQGKWYTNINSFKLEKNGDGVDAPADDKTDDLPF